MQISEHSTGSAICRYRLQLSLNEPEGGHCFHWGGEEVLVGDEIKRSGNTEVIRKRPLPLICVEQVMLRRQLIFKDATLKIP